MTYNQIITLLNNIAVAHKQLKSFETGELWEVEGNIKLRTFTLLVFGQVKKDKSDEQEILSDCESILDDIIKILLNESNDYDLIGDPVLNPFKEELGDW